MPVEASPEQTGSRVRLVEVQVADEPAAWAAAGFATHGDLVPVGPVALRSTGRPADGTRGVTGWTMAGLDVADGHIDGLPTRCRSEVRAPRTTGPIVDAPPGADPVPTEPAEHPTHPNGVIGLDHVVVLTPDLERTIAAVEATGLDLRRIRETSANGSPMRQAFFKLGPVVLEVVSGDAGTGVPVDEAPATFFGLAMDVDDLEVSALALGDHLGRIKPAVQPGRRIATVRHRPLDLSVPIALMDRRGDRTAGDGGR